MNIEEEPLSDFAIIDVNDYKIEDWDIDPSTIEKRSFKDEKGKDQSYFNGGLTYKGKTPLLVAEGDSWGVQEEDESKKKKMNDQEGGDVPGATPLPSLVQLPVGLAAAAPTTGADGKEIYVKKKKYQVSIILTVKPAPKDWTPAEKRLIEFLDVDLRRIIAHILSTKMEILQTMQAPVVTDAQLQLNEEFQDPTKNQNLMTPEGQMARFTQIVKDKLMGKITRKVYRKKKQTKNGEKINLMDANSQYDETASPTLYAGVMNYIDKQTKEEVVTTVYNKFMEGVTPDQYPTLTHAEALAMGRYHMQAGIRLDQLYLGASYSVQSKAGNLTFVYPIQGGGAKNSRIVMPAPIKRDNALIQKYAINPGAGNSGPVASPVQAAAPVASYTAPPPAIKVAFDPSQIPGISGIPAPFN